MNKLEKAKLYYLQDLIFDLKAKALEAAQESNENRTSEFLDGFAVSALQTISSLQNKAKAFGIPLRELNLHDIDPEGDPLGEKKRIKKKNGKHEQ